MLASRQSLLRSLSAQLRVAQNLAWPSSICSGDVIASDGLHSLFSRPGQANVAASLHSSARCRGAADQFAAGASSEPSADVPRELDRKALVNRMLYRSRQRGFLELDLLIGMWAEREVPRMSAPMIREFEAVLDQENPDMFKWLTSQEEAPEALQRNSAFQALQAHVRSMTDKHHSVPPAAGAAPKEWVRGWTDKGEELAPKSG
ncbi:hypothetical protein ABPG77_002491 [Micractinium sp. CCAP 211/92]